jgi:hypothetical protein
MSKKENKSIFEEIFTPQALFEELVYGSIAGCAICISGHPFEYLILK